MALDDTDVDWFLTAQFVVSSESKFDELAVKLIKMSPFVESKILLKLILAHAPMVLCDERLTELVSKLLKPVDGNTEFTDMASIWEPSSIPTIMELELGTSRDDKLQSHSQSVDYINQICFKYGWDDSDDLLSTFLKALIVKLNDLTSSFTLTDAIVASIDKSENIKTWINTFYYPLQNFQVYSTYTLHDYQVILSIPEQIEIMLNQFVKSGFNEDIIIKTIIPYFDYIGKDSWISFNEWFTTLGEKIINGSNKTTSVLQYQTILEFIRRDQLLKQINKTDVVLRLEFVTIVILVILLNPDTVLEEIVYSKEILTLLKGLDIPETSDFNLNVLKECKSISDCSHLITPSISLINYILKVIETGEILSSNNLSFMGIIDLENNGHDVQLAELQKFINVESTYVGSTSKSWSITLSSIYPTLKTTKIFQNVTIDELSEIILIKLLDVKHFDFIKEEFLTKFNSLNPETTKRIILSNAWDFYTSASSCDPHRGGLKVSLQNLSLLNNEDEDVCQLRTLIKANEKLLNWKIFFKSGVPITPNNILTMKDPMRVIQRILDLNDHAYTSIEELYNLLTLLIIGLKCENSNPLFQYASNTFRDEKNLLALSVKLISLQYSSTVDMEFSYKLSNEILDLAMEDDTNTTLISLLNENWIIFFTLAKFEFSDNIDDDENDNDSKLIQDRMNLLSKLILFTPVEFNTQVLEYWQMLNSQYDHHLDQQDNTVITTSQKQHSVNMGDLKNRLQRSLNSTADIDTSDIGKNIIGWIVGAN